MVKYKSINAIKHVSVHLDKDQIVISVNAVKDFDNIEVAFIKTVIIENRT